MRVINLLISILVFIWCIGYFWFIHEAESFELENRTQTDTIIIFGGNKQSLYIGVQLVKLGYAPIMFVTGDRPAEEYTPFLREQNITSNQVVFDVEYANENNDYGREAATFMRRYKFETARLVAPSYQIKRALIDMNANLPMLSKVIPHPVSLKKHNYNMLFFEYNKYVLMFVANILGIANEVDLSYS